VTAKQAASGLKMLSGKHKQKNNIMRQEKRRPQKEAGL